MEDEYEDEFHVTKNERRLRRRQWRAQMMGRISAWFGAALAMILIGGLVFWGYQLGQRDASVVPVIRAALEPAKVQPDDPGGAEVAHQDITSFSAGDGTSAPKEMTFAPPTERPAEEDVPMGVLQEPEAGAGGTETVAAVDADEEPDPPVTDATEQAPNMSPVAPTRPSDLKQRMAVAKSAISEDAELASRAAASVVQIQLGAFPDRSLTKSEWARIYKANVDIMSGRALVVQSTISGGRRFFRLRAGPFKDRVEAQNVCRALQAREQDCLVVVNR